VRFARFLSLLKTNSNHPFLDSGLEWPDSRCSPRIFNNVLYVGALDGNLYALDPNSGSVLWKYQTGGPIIAAPAVTSDAIYVPACTPGTNGTFYKLNLNGQLIWKNSVPYVLNATANSGYFFVAAPTVAPDLGMVFLRNGFRRTYGINATTGDILWSYDGRYNIGTLTTGGNQQGGVLQVNSPLYKYGRIYMNDYYGIVCLNATSGNQTWYSFLSRENLAQGLAYSYSRVYSVNELGVVYVLDADTGQKVSYYEVGNSQLHSTPSLYNNSLYIGSFNWYMYCLGDAKIMYAQDATAPSASPAPAPTPTPAPTADEVAQKVLAALPAYPSIPSADEVAQKVVASLPSGVSADEVAQKVLASLPANPNADQIAQAINNQLSTKPVSVPAEYIAATIVLIVGVMVAIAIGVVNLFLVRKRK
jgi:outer membrane protein assembly factor BamB